jgi:hypothetical protein
MKQTNKQTKPFSSGVLCVSLVLQWDYNPIFIKWENQSVYFMCGLLNTYNELLKIEGTFLK